MDSDIFIDDEDLVEHLTKEYQSTFMDYVDASPSEILADVASILAAPISPVLSNKTTPNESAHSDSGSDDDFRVKQDKSSSSERQSSQSPIDWASNYDNEPQIVLKPEDVELFIQKTNPITVTIPTNASLPTNISTNEPIPNSELPQRTGPVMAIENGIIKGVKLTYNNDDEELKTNLNLTENNSPPTGSNLNKPFFNVVNENLHLSNTKKDGNASVSEPKQVPNILKRSTNLLFTEPQSVAIPAESTNKTKIAILPLNKNKTQCDRRIPRYQIKATPPGSISPTLDLADIQFNRVTSPQVPLSINNVISPLANCPEFNDAERRAMKKQQRMIKNRETACRSRQKKKEYLAELEQKLLHAQQEIIRLQAENRRLQEQLLNNGRNRIRHGPFYVPRKNIALIFAMVFMVSMNFNFTGWETKPFEGPPKSNQGSRHLLWSEDTSDMLPTDYDKYENRSIDGSDCRNATINSNFLHINQTESMRIAGDLSRWIGNGKTLNWTNSSKKKRPVYVNEQNINGGFPEAYKLFNKLNFDSNVVDISALNKNHGKNVKDKSRLRRLRRALSVDKEVNFADGTIYYEDLYRKPMRKPINDFDFDDLSEWNELLRALHRRDDTFYVLGVGKGEHLLLPAVAHNVTRPPKMALILPARTGNDSQMTDHVTLMQIDCSVVNTTLVKLKSESLPESLRKSTHDSKARENGGHKVNKDDIDASLSKISRNAKINESSAIYPQKKPMKPSNIDSNKKDSFAPYVVSKMEESKKVPQKSKM